jgi:hypothetical protein
MRNLSSESTQQFSSAAETTVKGADLVAIAMQREFLSIPEHASNVTADLSKHEHDARELQSHDSGGSELSSVKPDERDFHKRGPQRIFLWGRELYERESRRPSIWGRRT